jgi:hypothetical protein
MMSAVSTTSSRRSGGLDDRVSVFATPKPADERQEQPTLSDGSAY